MLDLCVDEAGGVCCVLCVCVCVCRDESGRESVCLFFWFSGGLAWGGGHKVIVDGWWASARLTDEHTRAVE